MADKALKFVKVPADTAVKIAVHNDEKYLLIYKKTSGTVTDYYHYSAPTTAMSPAPYIFDTVSKVDDIYNVCVDEQIATNDSIEVYYKIYNDYYESYDNKLVGVHPKDRRP